MEILSEKSTPSLSVLSVNEQIPSFLIDVLTHYQALVSEAGNLATLAIASWDEFCNGDRFVIQQQLNRVMP